jgi:sigma-B regulation protein RsbU (phosphoserine phosphatase)
MNTASDEFGDARLLDVAQGGVRESVQVQVDRVIAAVRAFATGAPQSDDITVMVLRYLGPGAS